MFRGDKNVGAFDVRPPEEKSSGVGFMDSTFGGGDRMKQAQEALEEDPESHLAQTMNQLSLEERDKALCDLHGVQEIPDESPEALTKKLADMANEIDRISPKNAYLIAKSLSPSYVTNEKMQLQFLRADKYDPKKAAERLVLFMERKLDIFGRDKLVKDIDLSDFSAEELEDAKSGFMMLLDQKDRSGRTILFAGRTDGISTESRQKMFYYCCSLASKDEECQKKGVVIVKSVVGQRNFFLDRGPKVVELLSCFPIKICGVHFCYDDALVRAALSACTFIMARKDLARFRLHYGSLIETFYALMGYGIDGVIPIGNNSRIKRESMEKWLEQKMQVEKKEHTTITPLPPDVLLGRGKVVRNHPGNITFRNQIEADRDEYDNSSKFDKSVMIETILTGVKASGGRFLQLGPGGYVEVDDDIARKRISHSWRNLRASKKPASPNTTVSLKRNIHELPPAPVTSVNNQYFFFKRPKF